MPKERPPLEEMTLRQLRKVASEYSISRYSRMRKSQLLAEIQAIQRAKFSESESGTQEAQKEVEAVKFELGQEDLTADYLSSVDEGLAELPDGYGESRVVLMPRDPQWAYAYWDIPNERKEELRRQGGHQPALRLYDVTDINLDYQSPHSIQEYPCDEMTREWYVPIPVSDRDYVVDIGYRSVDGRWLLLARSAPARIPPVYPSDWIEEQFLTISWEEELQGKTFLELVPSERLVRIPPEPIFDAEAERLAGSLYGSMHQVPGSVQPVSSYEQSVSSYAVSSYEQSVSSYAVSSYEQSVSSYAVSSYEQSVSSYAVSSYEQALSSYAVSSFAVPVSSYAVSSYEQALSSYAVSSFAVPVSSYAVSSYEQALSSYAVSSFAVPVSSYAISSYEQALSSYAVSSFAVPVSSYAVSSYEQAISSFAVPISSYGLSSYAVSSYEQAVSSYAVPISSYGLSSYAVSSYEQAISSFAVPISSYGLSSYAVSSYEQAISSFAVPISSYGLSSYAVSSYEQAISSYGLSSYAVPISSYAVSSYAFGSYEQAVSSYAVPISSYGLSSYGVSSYEQAASSYAVPVSSYAVSSYAVSSYEQGVSSYVMPSGMGMWAVPNMSGVSGMGFSASAPPIKPRKFWLVADAELIVYGATEPDATVTIGGKPIKLNPDGTFRFQMSFQDGLIDYPILAIAADGEQTRSIHMKFNRETPSRHTNTKEEAFEEWF